MNTTRAKSAAGPIAKAVQNAARAAKPPQADLNKAAPKTIAATVVHAIEGAPYTIEIDGRVFEPVRDQQEARRAARIDEICDEIEAIAGDQRKHVSWLLGEMENLWGSRVEDVRGYTLRRVGFALMENHMPDLWRLLYAELGPSDDRHRPQAAADFLHDVESFEPGRGW